MSNSSVILVTLVAYKAILIAIGFWAQRRTSSNEDFFLGGRQLGPFVAAMSYSA
ncbi:MAG: sodium/proline symporter, partial [Proteobacteria bacterium]|nr:sodium/proline symporter [Pseudomonadota bacterium]